VKYSNLSDRSELENRYKMAMQTKTLLFATLTKAAFLFFAVSSPAIAAERPNIILIMCDDMGYEGVSAYGSESYHTPNLNRLAAEGALFDHCYSQPICTPSRVQIMTGKYNFRNYTRFGALAKSETTFGNLLRDAGYATLVVGKWQLGGGAETVRKFGFDEHCLWHLDGRDSRFWQPRIMQNGKLLAGLDDQFGPDVVSQYLLDFLERNQNKPFFAYYPMMLVHWPFVPTPDSPPGGSRQRSGKYDGQKGGTEYFPDMVAYMDKIVGRIIAKLEELHLRENTLVLFTGDNGCATNIRSKMGQGFIQGGKGSMPDAGTHVALVANWPGVIPQKSRLETLVDFTDLLPTLADAAGIATPQNMQLDGRSFLPQLRGEKGNPREWVFCHYRRNGAPKAPANSNKRRQVLRKQEKSRAAKQLGRFARNQRFKLYDDGRFYDVSADVLELHDLPLGKASANAEKTRRMLQRVHDSMPPWRPFQTTRK